MIRYDPLCCIVAALLLLLLPVEWLLSFMTAALVHESAHILAVLLFRGRIHSFRISVTGCSIECGEMTEVGNVMSILAGPVCSLLLVCFRRITPQIAVGGLCQGLFNLLPVLPLDGGRILQILLFHFCPQKEARIMGTVKYTVWFVCAGILAGFLSMK